jgi:hypothetical protein
MVQIIPNYASVVATVLTVETSDVDKAMDTVTLQINELKDHQHYPNLIRPLPDNRLRVTIKRSAREALGLNKNTKISALVRAAGGNNYYFNDGSIEIMP